MPDSLPSLYDPFATELKWQQFWQERGFYQADPAAPGHPFSLVLPPPNVTGNLHMGHALSFTLPDVIVRYRRMLGDNVVWIPGTDHASIAVHTILEKQLRQEGKTRFDIGREAFLEKAWAWKAASQGTIIGQLQRLGLSLDWSRLRFTLDQGLNQAVIAAFVQLAADGLIYRGEYLVNWCPATQSAVSDIEVDEKEVQGSLWHLRYPLTEDPQQYLVVATTRPETMLGDTAVAVHPDDERYRHWIGKTITLPIRNRLIPIIGDPEVDPSFGSGCVKITPAHDHHDFEVGKRHHLPMITIMNPDGTINAAGDPFTGMDRFAARSAIVEWFAAHHLLEKVEPYTHNVPHSDRGGVPVEPLLSIQWFCNVSGMAQACLQAQTEQTSPRFVPERWTKVYTSWLENIRPWCLSRQLWWGHQIPAWYPLQDGQRLGDHQAYIVAPDEDQAYAQARAIYGQDVVLERDPDVLDTWFSSGLWPFSTLGWPESTPDLQRYYPNSLMATGFDIIFFWVARMTMLGTYLTGQMPFADVYINGLVRDELGQKMSKTKGNGVDPLELLDSYGTDALRYALIKEVIGAGQDIRFPFDRESKTSSAVEAARHFANKIWNASRFVLMHLQDRTPQSWGSPDRTGLEAADRWMLSRLHHAIAAVRDSLDSYHMGDGARILYSLIWDDFCDQYIELVKPRLRDPDHLPARQVLAATLETILALLHPWMPHITEELWQRLTQADLTTSLSVQPYPEVDPSCLDPDLEQAFSLMFQVIRTIRNLRVEAGIPPGVKVPVVLQTNADMATLEGLRDAIQDLGKVSELTLVSVAPVLAQVAVGVAGSVQVLLPLEGVVDVGSLQRKLHKDLEKIRKEMSGILSRLDNPSFVSKAPPEVLEKNRSQLAALHQQEQILQERLEHLG